MPRKFEETMNSELYWEVQGWVQECCNRRQGRVAANVPRVQEIKVTLSNGKTVRVQSPRLNEVHRAILRVLDDAPFMSMPALRQRLGSVKIFHDAGELRELQEIGLVRYVQHRIGGRSLQGYMSLERQLLHPHTLTGRKPNIKAAS